MNVLFIWPDINADSAPWHIQMGVAYLSAVLKKSGHSTELLKVVREMTPAEFCDVVDRFKPDLFAFSVMTPQYDNSLVLSRWAKERYPNIPILYGGHHATLDAENVLSEPSIDMICRGEGEAALLELVGHLEKGRDYSDVRNLWIKKDGGIIRNEIRPIGDELEEMPFMDIELFHPESSLTKQDKMVIQFMAGRGCPFQCAFCCNPAINRLYNGKGSVCRTRSAERAIEELEYHIAKYPRLSFIDFMDETFNLHKGWVKEFCALYKKRIGLPFALMARPERMDEEIAKTLKEAGCVYAAIGIESGSEWLRTNVMKREMSNQEIINAFNLVHKYGLRSRAFAMIGVPHETPDMVRETLSLLKRCNPNVLKMAIFYPLPGTELYEECKREGWLTDEKVSSCFERSILNLPTISPEEIKGFFNDHFDDYFRWSSKKESYGSYDFLVHLDEAEVESENPDFVKVQQFVDSWPRRFVIMGHPPARITYRDIAIPKKASLDFDISMAPYTYDKEGGGVTFQIFAGKNSIFKKRLDPKRRKKDRGWHPFRINLKKYGGSLVDFAFVTKSGDNRYCNAGWGRPVILRDGKEPKFSDSPM